MKCIYIDPPYNTGNEGWAYNDNVNSPEIRCWLGEVVGKEGETLDRHVRFWVRNLVRREGSSFFLQKADGRFYPDFLCQLPDREEKPGPVLVVEYKGANGWAAAEDDRLIGGLWANLSQGRCRFVMVTNRSWDAVEPSLV